MKICLSYLSCYGTNRRTLLFFWNLSSQGQKKTRAAKKWYLSYKHITQIGHESLFMNETPPICFKIVATQRATYKWK